MTEIKGALGLDKSLRVVSLRVRTRSTQHTQHTQHIPPQHTQHTQDTQLPPSPCEKGYVH